MSGNVVVKAEGVGKKFQLGAIGSATLREQLQQNLSRITGRTKTETSEFWALQDINFELNKGEVLGIIGKNGSGKSTLLKILSRITAPTEGRVEIDGKLSSLLEVGTGFHPELTGRENIFLNGSILGMTRKEVESKFDQIVEFADITQFIDTPVKRYSSGMYVRLAFAVAAHLQPEILIVDEVLAVGDYEFQKKCLGKMNEVASEGRSVIFVSHNMGAVADLCSRVIQLKEGRVVYDGPVDQGIRQYISNTKNQRGAFKLDASEIGSNAAEINYISEAWTSNSEGERTPEFTLDQEISLNVNYQLNTAPQNIRVSVILYRDARPVFTSFSDDQGIVHDQSGEHQITFNIAPHFLKAGEYSAELFVSPPLFKSPLSLDFTVHEDNENTFHKGYRKDRLGEVIAQAKWVKK